MQLRIMTFNIRYAKAHDGQNNWENRKAYVIDLIRKSNPQIICFQEVLADPLTFLTESLPEFQWYGVGRDDGKAKGEYAPIFYHKTFTIAEKGTFWLSDTPDQPSLTWGIELMPRICTWIHFNAEKSFVIYNTHLPLRREPSKRSIPLLLNRVQTQSGKIPVILTGDFNLDPNSERYRTLSTYYRDGFLEIAENRNKDIITFHRFTGALKPTIRDREIQRIDYFWVSSQIKVRACQILTNRYPEGKKDIYPSDHYPMIIDIDL